ncbi:MAG: ATP-binding protein [Coriobacteriales bacterium]|jgi:hypothetical protein
MVFPSAYDNQHDVSSRGSYDSRAGREPEYPAGAPYPTPRQAEATPPFSAPRPSSYEWAIVDQRGYFDLDESTVDKYLMLFRLASPNHAWLALDKHEFLTRTGALEQVGDGQYAATAAGLLMFGRERDIVRVFPSYFLDCRIEDEVAEGDYPARARWKSRFTSQDGDWSGNLLDFYHRAFSCLVQDFPAKVAASDGQERGESLRAARAAVKEALVNALVNADFTASGGVVARKTPGAIEIANPGRLGVDLDLALTGGVTNPHNKVIARMFAHAGLCDRAGYGLPCIIDGWRKAGMATPRIEELSRIVRVRAVLPLDGAATPDPSPAELELAREMNARVGAPETDEVSVAVEELLLREVSEEPSSEEAAPESEGEVSRDVADDTIAEPEPEEAVQEAKPSKRRDGKRKSKGLRRKGEGKKASRKEKKGQRSEKADKKGRKDEKIRLKDLEKVKRRKKKRGKKDEVYPMPDDVVAQVRDRLREQVGEQPKAAKKTRSEERPQKTPEPEAQTEERPQQTTTGHGAFMYHGHQLTWGDSGDPMD